MPEEKNMSIAFGPWYPRSVGRQESLPFYRHRTNPRTLTLRNHLSTAHSDWQPYYTTPWQGVCNRVFASLDLPSLQGTQFQNPFFCSRTWLSSSNGLDQSCRNKSWWFLCLGRPEWICSAVFKPARMAQSPIRQLQKFRQITRFCWKMYCFSTPRLCLTVSETGFDQFY